ncbi:MAG: CDP-alcohol phosphatidyltransferase family protein, partial [Anaerotignum sp.]
MEYLANIITFSRIIAALAILQTEAVSPLFYALFLFCGITDILDGRIARRMGSQSRAGAILDSVADIIFALVCFVKLFPVIELPLFLWIWIGGIAAIRGINLIFGYI